MAEEAAALVAPFISNPERRAEVVDIIYTRMGSNHDEKRTGTATLVDKVRWRNHWLINVRFEVLVSDAMLRGTNARCHHI